jgi:DNA-binding HxlR family transcriptional regulator
MLTLHASLLSLTDWAERHRETIPAARRSYDERVSER